MVLFARKHKIIVKFTKLNMMQNILLLYINVLKEKIFYQMVILYKK